MLTPNFTATQPVGEPSVITLTDTSSGSDGAITSRRAYFRTSSGTFLVPSGNPSDTYVLWPLADVTYDFDVLNKDYALDLVVEWLNVSNAVLYAKTIQRGFTSYNEDFDYQLTQLLSGNPLLINDNNFFNNKSDLRTEIDSGNQALERAADLFAAQQCYDRATELREKSQYFFNGNN